MSDRPPLWSAALTPASAITPSPIRWLWPGWLARGKLTILAGAAGCGKTTLAIGLAAITTTGGRWPDNSLLDESGNVLIWSAEDDIGDTLVPRLIAAGANLDRVHFVEGRVNRLGQREPFDPAVDFDLLQHAVEDIGGVALLIVDPVVSLVSGDMHRANDVRRALQPLVDFAGLWKCAALGISHFSKGSATSTPIDRLLGSQAFGALARMVLVAAKQEDSEERVLARAKANIGKDTGGVGYTIEECQVLGEIETTRVRWGSTINGSAREILSAIEELDDGHRKTELEEAIDFLREILQSGPVATNQLKRDAQGAGIAWATIRRAQKAIGAVARKGGMETGWFWALESEDAHSPPKVLTPEREHLREKLSTFSAEPVDRL